MFFVYILKNPEGKHYIGYTSKDLEERVREHNSAKGRWTRHKGPWILVHSERFNTKAEAFKREQQIKKYKGGRALQKLVVKQG